MSTKTTTGNTAAAELAKNIQKLYDPDQYSDDLVEKLYAPNATFHDVRVHVQKTPYKNPNTKP